MYVYMHIYLHICYLYTDIPEGIYTRPVQKESLRRLCTWEVEELKIWIWKTLHINVCRHGQCVELLRTIRRWQYPRMALTNSVNNLLTTTQYLLL